jgi:hypothetical protein
MVVLVAMKMRLVEKRLFLGPFQRTETIVRLAFTTKDTSNASAKNLQGTKLQEQFFPDGNSPAHGGSAFREKVRLRLGPLGQSRRQWMLPVFFLVFDFPKAVRTFVQQNPLMDKRAFWDHFCTNFRILRKDISDCSARQSQDQDNGKRPNQHPRKIVYSHHSTKTGTKLPAGQQKTS